MSDVEPTLRTGPASNPLLDDECAVLRARLVRAVARVCPSWLAAQAEDIVQAALVRVVEIIQGREGNARPNASYLWKAAYTATVDEIRRHRRRREVPLDDGLVEGTVRSREPGPEEAGTGWEIGRELRKCLGRLVEARRLALVLHLQGHTGPEAARLLGWSEKRVENLIYRGLADVRRCLEQKGMRP